jgi:glycosyltransferase involved in cell wall biosynthesis
MKVCHIITRMILGGAQENTFLTCKGLAERGWDVSLLAGPQTGAEGSLQESCRQAAFRFEIIESMLRQVSPLSDRRAVRAMRAWLERERPAIVHTHSSKAGILGRMAARQAGVPIIIHTVHGMSFNRTQNALVRRVYRGLERYCATFTDRIIAVADAMIDQTVKAGVAPRDKCVTIYSGMEVDRFDPALYDRAAIRARFGVPADAIVVSTVARMFANKGYEQLIPAMARIVRQAERAHFLWIGDGPKREQYLQQVSRMGLRDRVHLTGLVPPEKVAECLSAADILVHASQWEGLPRVVVQALLLERPAVAFDVDGTPEVVLDGRTGVLVRLNDIEGLAGGAVRLARDDALRVRLGRQGRQLCVKRFDWHTMVEQIEAVYRDLARLKGIDRSSTR